MAKKTIPVVNPYHKPDGAAEIRYGEARGPNPGQPVVIPGPPARAPRERMSLKAQRLLELQDDRQARLS